MASNGHSNGHHHGGNAVTVIYKITNSESDRGDSLFNAFQMPYGNGPTLSAVKRNFVASHSLSHLGPEGYHWRVMVEDKPVAAGAERTFSWWDIQDGNAKLPVKETSQYELRKLLFPPAKQAASTTDTAAKAAKGAFKMMGKMASAVAGEDLSGSADVGAMVPVLAFKLLDLVKLHDDANLKHGGGRPESVGAPVPKRAPQPRGRPGPSPTTAPVPRTHQQPHVHQQQHASSAQRRAPQPVPARQQPPQRQPAPQRHTSVPHKPRASAQEASLMDFGENPAPNRKVLHHTFSSPAALNTNESRVERLKRERLEKEKTANRVWDDVDQRWVEVDPRAGMSARATPSAPPGASQVPAKKKVIGIKIDSLNAQGKSDTVRKGVEQRVNEMEENQKKALLEVREREARKKKEEEEEDVVRKQLEPKIKAWSEEHGKKKQLRALLASLHTILWPGAKWKQINIGDVLDDGKVKKFFHKATLVVHPDKTGHLPPDQRFLAKRIFDALCQAKTDFDSGAK